MKKCYFFALILILLISSGCAGPPKNFRVTMNDLYALNNNGIVFGRITTQRFFGLFMYNADNNLGVGMKFKNIQTGEGFTYVGAKYFEMMLPTGCYEISSIGSPSGALSPKTTPFTFSVKSGDIKYVGSIVGDRDLLKLLDRKGVLADEAYKEIISTKIYGSIEYFIVDEYENVVDEFLSKHPEFRKAQVKTDFIN